MAERVPIPMCPMAAMCKRMMGQQTFRYSLLIPGVLLIILGMTVLIEPRILIWFAAIAFIVMGIAMLMIPKFMHSVGERLQDNNR